MTFQFVPHFKIASKMINGSAKSSQSATEGLVWVQYLSLL